MCDPLTKLVAMDERDIAEAKRQNAVLLAVIEALPDGLIVVDLDGKITMANQKAVLLFGYPRTELVGRSVESLLPERLRHAHVQLRQNFNSFDASAHTRVMGRGVPLVGLRKDGRELSLEIQFAPFTVPDGIYNVALIHRAPERVETQMQRPATDGVVTDVSGSE